ncbi:MAG: BMP family ABC transporter substrate-binding protein [Lachnospiraceae bacterium]|nr:BMP family ABC transporter substrate-binding protein [Lachnospiraceae bacterium]
MIEEYNKARRIGEKQVHKAIAAGGYPYPPALDDLIEPGLPEYPVGLTEIPMSMIAGTKVSDRQNAFSYDFMPVLNEKSEFAFKWSNLYDSQMEEGIREPIKVYEYLRRFYVQEGNKRVSVSKYVKIPLILADVTRLMPRKRDEKDIRIYYEFVDFYSVAPIYDIGFSEEGSYARLAEMVGQNMKDPWPDDVVKSVHSAYLYFAQIFEAKARGGMKLTTGDAFLLYLKIYRLDSLLNEAKSEITRRINKIWNEVLVQNHIDSEKITLVESPGKLEEAASPQVGGLLSMLVKPAAYTESNPLKVAFLFDKNPESSSWIYGHELGRNRLEQAYPGIVETVRFDGCGTDAAIRKAVEAAAADLDDLVISTSPAQMPEILRCAIDYPQIKFMNCSVNLSHNAVRCYYGRMYEAKFLMGALAASVADNHRIGYRADYPIYGTIANINAFAIGAALVDPEAKLYLSWSTKKNTNWQEELFAEGVSIISGPDMIRPGEASREYGIYRYSEDGSVQNLAMPVWDWGRYYELIVDTILRGTWDAKALARKDQALNYWWGMESQVIDVILSEKLSYYSVKMVNTLKKALVAGTLNPFDGELHSQEKLIKAADSPRLSNEEIIRMNWLNDNVVGSIPVMEELNESAKDTVQVSGVNESSV